MKIDSGMFVFGIIILTFVVGIDQGPLAAFAFLGTVILVGSFFGKYFD